MMRFQGIVLLLAALCVSASIQAQSPGSAGQAPQHETVLAASDITPTLFPDRVFYHGKTATTEMRNTGGVRFADGSYFLAGIVDSSGYSTAVKEKYQFYLLVEVPVEFGGQQLKPGAYGAGFVSGNFLVTDLGGNDVFQVPANRDTDMKRPIPLQVIAGAAAGTYRLYRGRDFVEFRRAQ
jgi:hypothetical protein